MAICLEKTKGLLSRHIAGKLFDRFHVHRQTKERTYFSTELLIRGSSKGLTGGARERQLQVNEAAEL